MYQLVYITMILQLNLIQVLYMDIESPPVLLEGGDKDPHQLLLQQIDVPLVHFLACLHTMVYSVENTMIVNISLDTNSSYSIKYLVFKLYNYLEFSI